MFFIHQNYKKLDLMMEWIPYSQFTNVKKIAEGGFGIVYRATWLGGQDETVILKRFKNSRNISKDFLNEVFLKLL
ncbi:hypothetical protein C1645_768356 [Glomus cerebriforme]|uniref:Protein kinase domain-containing protein n=1 Tax=Glomus cerebriforme TaxID=658196 RepID=A0A397T4L1_9GLOM|nr:hypothetical protein C1645_768356 [Glomus cerebriforme]